MFYDFVSNVLDVLFLCGIVIWINLCLNKKYSPYFLGIMFGLITIFVMNGKITVVAGRFYDFRHITMTMAGFIGGPVTATIAAIISSLYRYSVGGTGSMGGVTSIIVFACFGSILGNRVKTNQNGTKLLFWFFSGTVMACIFLFIIGFIPPWKGDTVKVLRVVTAPYLIITPLATTIIFNFYFWTYEFFGKASILNTIINDSPLSLMINDNQGPIMLSKNLKKLCQTSPKSEELFRLTDTDLTCLNTTKKLHREITTEYKRNIVADFSGFQMPNGENAYIAIVNDITDLKKDREKLRGATDRFQKAFHLGPDMMAIIQKSDYRYLHVNERFLEERGYTLEDIIGKTPIEMGVPRQEFDLIIKSIEATGSIHNVECTLITKFGSIGTALLSAETISMDDQECILFAYNDVTEMKRMQSERVEQLTKYLSLEADLSRSNQLIADIINHMPDGFYVLDNQWRFKFVNKKTEDFFNKTREELLERVLWKIDPQALGTLIEQNFRKARKNYESITFEYLSSLQLNKWYQITVYPSQLGLSIYYRDITEQKLALEQLMRSQEQTASILESMTDGFIAFDRDEHYIYINRAAEIALGKSRNELLGKKMTELYTVNSISLKHYYEVVNEKKSVTFEILSEALNSNWFEISMYPSENGVTCFFRDITSRKIAQEEMARLDRLNLVGQLAAGIGHEIRNPMTTVRGYLQLLGVKPEYAAQKQTFDLMISELDRANSIITEFLSLAQTKRSELKAQNLNDILNQLYPLLEADTFTQNKKIRCTTGEIPTLFLNTKEINQLILNLARNGLEAMEEGGCLTIESYLQNDKVVLAIEDEGCGIPPEHNHKLGTPFFTTKDYGTGLGLATCYKIAESHNAKICIDSNSSGTTFYIVFPITDKEREQNSRIA